MDTYAIDLVAVASALPPQHKRLSRHILRLRDIHSARTDLKLALDFVDSLKQIKQVAMAAEAGAVSENCAIALFYSAIVLYARATKTTSAHRRAFDFRKQFSDSELKAHRVLCDLRDDAIAHFGPGGSYVGPAWQKEGVFLPRGDQRIMTASRRIVLNPQLIETLDRQVHRALMVAERYTQDDNAKTVAALNEAVEQDPDFPAFCRAREIDLIPFFGSSEAARDALSGVRVGARKGKSRHGNT